MKYILHKWLGIPAIFLLCLLFFYPVGKGYIPFPGDILVGHYAPYKQDSHLGYPPGGVPHKAQGIDVVRQLYPWKLFVIESLKLGEIPFWTPYNFSGNHMMANFQSGVFNPLNIVFFLLPFESAWTLFIFLTPFLAGWFMYLYLKEKQLSYAASLFGGLAFSFSSYMTVWMEYGNIGQTLLWLPLSLLVVDKFLETQKTKYLLFNGMILLASLLAGYIQGFFYVGVVVACHTLLICWSRKDVKPFLFLLPSFIVPIFLGMFQLLPTLSAFAASSRGGYTLEQITFLQNPFWYVVTVLIPDFFGNPATRNHWFNGTYIERVSYFGVIPFFFALYALTHGRKRTDVKYFGFLGGIVLLLTTNLFITKYFFLLPIPVISTAVPTRMLSLFVFAGSILAAIGLDIYIKHEQIRLSLKKIIAIGTAFFVLVGVFICVQKYFLHTIPLEHLMVSFKNTIFSSLLFLLFIGALILYKGLARVSKSFATQIFVICIFAITIFDLFRFFHKITPFSPREFIYPKTELVSYIKRLPEYYRFWGYDAAYIDSNFQSVDRVYSPEGNDALHDKWYTELLMSSKDGKLPEYVSRADANIFQGNSDVDMRNNEYRQNVLNVVGVKYVIHQDSSLSENLAPLTSRFLPERYELVWQHTPWQIYENKGVTHRTYFTSQYVVETDEQKMLATLHSSEFDERSTLVLLDRPSFTSSPGTVSAQITSYSPNKVQIKVNAPWEGLVYLSDVFDTHWKARVNGNESKVYRANYAFRAVEVQPGENTIEFFYKDSEFEKGILISLFSGIAFIGYLAFYERKYKQHEKI